VTISFEFDTAVARILEQALVVGRKTLFVAGHVITCNTKLLLWDRLNNDFVNLTTEAKA